MTRNYTEFGSFENLRMPLDKITHKILYNSNKNVCFVHSSRIGLGAGGMITATESWEQQSISLYSPMSFYKYPIVN